MSVEPSPLVQGITWTVSVAVAAVAAIVVGIRRGFKEEAKSHQLPGSGDIVMGALIERTLITDLTRSILALDGTLREVLEVMREAQEEAEIEARVAEKVRAELARRGIHHGSDG